MKRLGFLFLSAFCVFSPVANALDIDDFDSNTIEVGIPPAITIVDELKSSVDYVSHNGTTISDKAIGGTRDLSTARTGGTGETALTTTYDSILKTWYLDHAQKIGAQGLSHVLWDGSTTRNSQVWSGLGGIDFTQDIESGTTPKILIGLDFDFPKSNSIELKLRIDDSIGNGYKYSEVKITLNKATPDPDLTNGFYVLEIPFTNIVNVGSFNIDIDGVNSYSAVTTKGPGGAVDLTNVGSVKLSIDGSGSAADVAIDYIRTNGKCKVTPDFDGDVIDECGVCRDVKDYYKKGKDDCGYCPNDTTNYKNYSETKDSCLTCKNSPTYVAPDLCNRCPSVNPNYGAPKDPCGVCDGNGSDCRDCSLRPQNIDRCGVCDGDGTSCLDCEGVVNGGKVLDECNVCGGSTKDASLCDVNIQCTTVEATGEILTFEKRLVEQATTIKKKFDGEKSRNKRNKCGINVKPSEQKVKKAYQTIKNVGNDIFTKGVEICGEGCVTVSYADQVKALMPTLKVIEKQTKSLANKVKKCYQKKKIKTTNSVAGVVTTINDVQSELNQLIQDCKDKQVCK